MGMGSSLAPPTTASTNGPAFGHSAEDELNAALIQQMMDEDENEIMANQMMQHDLGGGQPGGLGGADGGLPFGMDEGANVRAADQ